MISAQGSDRVPLSPPAAPVALASPLPPCGGDVRLVGQRGCPSANSEGDALPLSVTVGDISPTRGERGDCRSQRVCRPPPLLVRRTTWRTPSRDDPFSPSRGEREDAALTLESIGTHPSPLPSSCPDLIQEPLHSSFSGLTRGSRAKRAILLRGHIRVSRAQRLARRWIPGSRCARPRMTKERCCSPHLRANRSHLRPRTASLPGFHHRAGKAALARCLSRNKQCGPRRARTRDVLGGRLPAPSGHGRLDTRAKPASWPIDGIGLSQGECLARNGYPPSIASRFSRRTFRPPSRASPPARAGTFPACPMTEEMAVSHGVEGGG